MYQKSRKPLRRPPSCVCVGESNRKNHAFAVFLEVRLDWYASSDKYVSSRTKKYHRLNLRLFYFLFIGSFGNTENVVIRSWGHRTGFYLEQGSLKVHEVFEFPASSVAALFFSVCLSEVPKSLASSVSPPTGFNS